MSGGSYDYAYTKIEDLASNLRTHTPERRAFQALLRNVAKAARAIEWVDSCDSMPGSENEAIMVCIAPAMVLTEAVKEATRVRDELNALLGRARE